MQPISTIHPREIFLPPRHLPVKVYEVGPSSLFSSLPLIVHDEIAGDDQSGINGKVERYWKDVGCLVWMPGLMLLPDMFWPALKGCSVFLVGKASKRGTTAHMYINYACSRESSLCCSLHSLQMDRFFLNNSLIKSFYLPIFRQLSATLITERDCSLERQQPWSGASWTSWTVLPPLGPYSSFSRGM